MTYYGFNLQWLYTKNQPVRGPDERVLDAIAAWGFNFVRLPTDYRLFCVDDDPNRPHETVLAQVDAILAACADRGIHSASSATVARARSSSSSTASRSTAPSST